MSTESVEVVRAAFEAWRREGNGLLDFLSDEIEWEVRPELPDAGRYKGHDGFRRLSARFDEVMDDMWFRPSAFIAAGESQVVVPLRWGGRGKGSGLITSVKEFATREVARQARGLRFSA
jgi:ketosteroid isomerase-like protein